MKRKRKQNTQYRFQSGMSTAELLVAGSVILSVSFGVATFLPAGFKANQLNRQKMVSSNLFHQVIEEVESLDFNVINTGSEEALGDEDTKIVVDTTDNNVTLSGHTVTGNFITIGSGAEALSFPRFVQINNAKYRIDVKIVKGRYNDLMATQPEIDVWKRLQNYLDPQAVASDISIEVTPGTKTGLANETPFEFKCVGDCKNNYKYSWNMDGEPLEDTATISGYRFGTGGNHTLNLTVSKVSGKNTTLIGSATPVTLNIQVPQVSITGPEPANPQVGQAVSFSATCTNCGTGVVYNWDPGDGSSKKTGSSVSFNYNQAGIYNVVLNAGSGTNTYASSSKSIKVDPVSTQPTVTLLPDTTMGIAGPASHADTTHFNFNLTSTGYKEKTLITGVNYTVDFGDGSTPETKLDTDPNDSLFPQFTHTYSTASTTPYPVSVTAVPVGLSGLNPSELTATHDISIIAKDVLFLDANETTVVAGSAVNFTASTKGIFESSPSYTWNFGDGSVETGSSFKAHTFSKAGTYNVTAQVEAGTKPSASKQIKVLPPAGAVEQAPMKKVYVYIRPWSNQPKPGEKPLASGVFLKGHNKGDN